MPRQYPFELNRSSHLADSLVFAALDKFTGTRKLIDRSITKSDGRCFGEPSTLVSGKIHGRFAMDQKVAPPNPMIGEVRWVPNDGFTIAAWVKPHQDLYNSTLLEIRSTANRWGYISIDASGFYAFSVWGATSTASSIRSLDGVISHVALKQDGLGSNAVKMFIDGVEVVSVTNNSNLNGDVNVYGYGGNYAGSSRVRGLVADGMVWMRPLPDSQIEEIADPANVMLSDLIRPVRKASVFIPPPPVTLMYWTGASNTSWNNAANWSASPGGPGGAGVPDPTVDVVFDENSSIECILNANSTAKDISLSGFKNRLNLDTYQLTADSYVMGAGIDLFADESNPGRLVVSGNFTVNGLVGDRCAVDNAQIDCGGVGTADYTDAAYSDASYGNQIDCTATCTVDENCVNWILAAPTGNRRRRALISAI